MNAAAAVTPSQEFALYHADRTAWLKLVAPRMAARLRATVVEQLPTAWSELARDYQRAVWPLLGDVTQEAIKLGRLSKIRTVQDCPMPERERDLFSGLAGGLAA